MSSVDPSTRLPEREEVRARRWQRDRRPERVLAIRLHAMGDTVLTLPYLQSFSRSLPGVRLDLLTRAEVADVPRSVHLFERVFAIEGGRSQGEQLTSALAMLPTLRAQGYDVILDLQRNRVSRLVRHALAPGAWSEFDRFSAIHAGERTRRTIEAIGLGPLDVWADLTLKDPSAGTRLLAAAGWDGTSALVVLNPAGAFVGRSWPLASYARFAALWMERVSTSTQFLLLGLPSLAHKARTLSEQLGVHLIDLVGRTTAGEAMALLARSRLVVSEDSGLMHMAWISGVRTLALFGASRGVWARPLGDHADWIRACERPDGACLHGDCARASETCLATITPEAVVARAHRLLERAIERPSPIFRKGRLYGPPVSQ